MLTMFIVIILAIYTNVTSYYITNFSKTIKEQEVKKYSGIKLTRSKNPDW